MNEGIVAWFNSKKGYGMISLQDCDEYALLHWHELWLSSGSETEVAGQKLYFQTIQGRNGLRAVNVYTEADFNGLKAHFNEASHHSVSDLLADGAFRGFLRRIYSSLRWKDQPTRYWAFASISPFLELRDIDLNLICDLMFELEMKFQSIRSECLKAIQNCMDKSPDIARVQLAKFTSLNEDNSKIRALEYFENMAVKCGTKINTGIGA